jgi:hypothetical protein
MLDIKNRVRIRAFSIALAAFAAGVIPLAWPPVALADGHSPSAKAASVKAPIADVMHCPLAFVRCESQSNREFQSSGKNRSMAGAFNQSQR